jgi:hypothetical protein
VYDLLLGKPVLLDVGKEDSPSVLSFGCVLLADKHSEKVKSPFERGGQEASPTLKSEGTSSK